MLVASGAIRALAGGAECASDRRGRRRWRQFIHQRLRSPRPRAAPAVTVGLGGTASLQWLSGTVQTNGFGLRATAGGGVGGNGGNAGDAVIGPCTGAMGVREAMAGRPVCFSAAARSRSLRFRLRARSRGSMSMQMAATAVLAGWPARELARGRQWRQWREWRNRQCHHPGHGDFEWVSWRRSDKWAGGPRPSQWRRRRPRWEHRLGDRPGRWRRVCGRRR